MLYNLYFLFHQSRVLVRRIFKPTSLSNLQHSIKAKEKFRFQGDVNPTKNDYRFRLGDRKGEEVEEEEEGEGHRTFFTQSKPDDKAERCGQVTVCQCQPNFCAPLQKFPWPDALLGFFVVFCLSFGFLDASTHLYKRVCTFVGSSIYSAANDSWFDC